MQPSTPQLLYVPKNSPAAVVEVWLLAGQSNHYYGATLSAGTDDATHPRLYQYAPRTGGTGTANTITANATNPLGWEEYGSSSNPNTHIGFSVGFFRDYYLPANPNKTVVVVPFAQGGTALNNAGQWLPYTGTLRGSAVSQTNAAITAATSYFGKTAVFGGVLWHQGEGDLQTTIHSYIFRSALDGLIDGFRTQINGASSSTPIIIGGLSNGSYTTNGIESTSAWNSDSTGTMWRNFLNGVKNCSAYTGYADSESPSNLAAATVHFSASDQRDLAGRYYTAYQAAVANTDPACTWDPYNTPQYGTSLHVFSNGNRDVSGNATGGWKLVKATRGRSSGKYYFEVVVTARGGAAGCIAGIANWRHYHASYVGDAANTGYGASLFDGNGQLIQGFTSVNALSSGASTTLAANDVIGFAVDMNAGKAWVSKNNTYYNSGDPAAGTSNWISWTPSSVRLLFPAASVYQLVNTTLRLCATAAQLTYSPPSGFSAWATT